VICLLKVFFQKESNVRLLVFFSIVFFFVTVVEHLFQSPWPIDDQSLLQAPFLVNGISWAGLRTLFTPGYHVDFYPIRDLTHLVENYFLGYTGWESGTFVYRFVNLMIYFYISILVYSLVKIFTNDSLIAFLGFFIWLFSPINFELVFWVSSRKDLMALMFTLVSLTYYLRGRIFLSGFFFILGLGSKSTYALAPLFYLFFHLIKDKKLNIPLFVIALLGLLWSLFQSWFYTNVNDMRFEYAFDYRVVGSLAGLGRSLVGVFNSAVNAVDVENWADWTWRNQKYSMIGLSLWLFLGYISLKNYKKLNSNILYVFLSLSLLIPTSALLFPHRNFYSVRYFIPFFALSLVYFCLVRNRYKELIMIIFSITNFIGFFVDKTNWISPISVHQKSLDLDPTNVSLMRMLYSAYDYEKSWGRLSRGDILKMNELDNSMYISCRDDFEKPKYERNMSFCLNYFGQIWINKPDNKNFDEKVSEYAYTKLVPVSLSEQYIKTKRLMVQTSVWKNDELKNEVREILLNDKKFDATEKGRLDKWRFLCLSGEESESGKYLYFLSNKQLLSSASFALFLGSKVKREFKVEPVKHRKCFEFNGVNYFDLWFKL